MNKYDIVRFIGESKSPLDAKTGEIAIIRSIPPKLKDAEFAFVILSY